MVRVYYPFHPLHGRDFKLLRGYRRASDTVVIMDPTDRRLTIPHWMTLADAAGYGISSSAHLSARSLLLLAELLELHAANNTP
jgi:hypothetical protein